MPKDWQMPYFYPTVMPLELFSPMPTWMTSAPILGALNRYDELTLRIALLVQHPNIRNPQWNSDLSIFCHDLFIPAVVFSCYFTPSGDPHIWRVPRQLSESQILSADSACS
jgi:hypothetical protein